MKGTREFPTVKKIRLDFLLNLHVNKFIVTKEHYINSNPINYSCKLKQWAEWSNEVEVKLYEKLRQRESVKKSAKNT